MTIISSSDWGDIVCSTGNMQQVEIDPDSIIWHEGGSDENPRCRLYSILKIGPMLMHIEATEIYLRSENGDRVPFDSDEALNCTQELVEGGEACELWSAHGMEGHAETLEIEGRHYIVFASPFCT